ncbi:MAG: hypothetical protein QM639_08515 [Rhodocyclaceae bacterium]
MTNERKGEYETDIDIDTRTGDRRHGSTESPQLPHERDQTLEHPQPPRDKIRQAQEDIESGKKDTDRRGVGGLDRIKE